MVKWFCSSALCFNSAGSKHKNSSNFEESTKISENVPKDI